MITILVIHYFNENRKEGILIMNVFTEVEASEQLSLIINSNNKYQQKYSRDLLHEFGCDNYEMSRIVLKIISSISELELEKLLISIYGKDCVSKDGLKCGRVVIHILVLYGEKLHIGISDIVNIIKSFEKISEYDIYTLILEYLSHKRFTTMTIFISLLIYDAMKDCESLDYKVREAISLYNTRKYILELKTNEEFTDIYEYLRKKCGETYIENFINFSYGNHMR